VEVALLSSNAVDFEGDDRRVGEVEKIEAEADDEEGLLVVDFVVGPGKT